MLSGEEQAIALFGGSPEDWRMDPLCGALIHWTGLQMSSHFLMAIPHHHESASFLTSALQRYIDGLPEAEQRHRQERFRVWAEAWQFRADFSQWMRDQWKVNFTPKFQMKYLRVTSGHDITLHEIGLVVPHEMKCRWYETFHIEEDFRAWLRAHPLVMTCYTTPDGKLERYELTDYPYPAESYYA